MPSNLQALGADSPIVSEVSFSAGAGAITLSGAGPRGDWFRFDDVYDSGVTIAIVISDDSGQKEAFFALFEAPDTLVPQIMIISTNGNAKISWPATGQRIVKPMLGVVPPPDPVMLPDAPPIGPLPGACLCPEAPAESPPPGNNGAILFVEANGLGTYIDPTISSRSIDLTTTKPNEVLVLKILVQQEGAPSQSQSPATISGVTTAGLTWTRLTTVTGQQSMGFGGGNTFLTSEIWWAIASVPAAYTALVSASGDTAWFGMIIGGFAGVDLVNPWDTDPSLPKIATSLTGTPGNPSITGVSTTAAHAMVLFFFDEFGLVAALDGPPGFTRYGNTQGVQAFIGLVNEQFAFYEPISTPLSNATLSAATHNPIPAPAWIVQIHALRAA